jgi:hypothetical protein
MKSFAAGNDGLETHGINMDRPNIVSLKFTSGQPELEVARLARPITVILREGPSKNILPNGQEDDGMIPFQNLDHQLPVVPGMDSLGKILKCSADSRQGTAQDTMQFGKAIGIPRQCQHPEPHLEACHCLLIDPQ